MTVTFKVIVMLAIIFVNILQEKHQKMTSVSMPSQLKYF
jgi:hypothetical protein